MNDIYEQYKQRLGGDKEAERLLMQARLRYDFPLLTFILGYRDLGSFHTACMADICKVNKLGEQSSRRLWLWARGHFKTSIITVAHTISLIINNPNIRILLVSNTLEVSKKILKEIKDHFTTNENFQYYFKEFCPKANKEGKIEFGTTEAFTIPNRTRVMKEPTIMVAGIGTNLTGLHFDYMKIDDLVTRDSVTNDTQIQASKDYYSSLRQLFDKPTQPKEDIVGTTYHFNDLYSGLLKNSKFSKSIIPAKKDGVVIFPERFSDEGLNSILNDPSVGPYDFNSQYLLNPVNPADAKFQESWWQTYTTIPDGCADYILVDPASTQKKKSDYTVIEHWKRDWQGNDYLVNAVRDKLTVFQRLDKIVVMAKNCQRLQDVKYEVLGGRHGDLESLRLKFMENNMPIIPKETKATNSSKKDRIEQRLVPRFHAKKIFFPEMLPYKSEFDGKVHDFVKDYKLEFLQHPYNEHDDILDCHTQLYEEPTQLINGLKPEEEKKQYIGTAQYWDDYYAVIDREQKRNPFITREEVVNRLKAKKWRRLLKV